MSAQKSIRLALAGTVENKFDYPLRSALVGIGSDPSNELVIDEPTVSRRHAEVIQRSGVFQIHDLGSTNGTFVNGKRVDALARIGAGDEIRFGAVSFYVRTETPVQPGKRRFRHAPIVVALRMALSGVSYQFVKNWLELLDGADMISSHRTPAATPLPLNPKPPRSTMRAESTPVSAPSVAAPVPTSASTTATSLHPGIATCLLIALPSGEY